MVQIIRLARKLPTGEVSALKSDGVGEQEEALDENDLTNRSLTLLGSTRFL